MTLGVSADLESLAPYLSSLGVADCDVVVLDASPRPVFDDHRRVLRWVARHLPAASGNNAALQLAIDRSACEKVILASHDIRYTPSQIDQLCDLLELHEVVEPHEYFAPAPWWSRVDAGRALVHRGVDPYADHGATFAFRRSAIRGLRGIRELDDDPPVRKLIANGAEVHPATDVFVLRIAPALPEWIAERPRQAMDDFAMPMKTAFFFTLAPMLLLLALLGGLRLASSYASAIAFASIVLAVRGRSGASSRFRLSSCLYAPLWIAERSCTVYWALACKLRAPAAAVAIRSADAPTADRHTRTSTR
ncbi:MAG TPA: hypothetical protein VMU84_07645 [Thermoanaerobaculia bacterium]|nr:hypothetical protein [Thermoanaerobaculia bacterium]